MARRSSARLRSRNSSTPKRVSLSHDVQARTPRTAPGKLSALQESDEMPGSFPQSISPPGVSSKQTTTVPVKFDDATPKNGTPITPAEDEMHPKQHQQSTAKPLDEARWLGFANMRPHTEPPNRASKITTLQGTPTKAPKSQANVDSSKYHFIFRREQSLELSPDAKRLMIEKREEALKIREQMMANEDLPEGITEAVGRKIAIPKGKKGRFSEVHTDQFEKMDSIAGHASSFRADPNRPNSSGTPTQKSSDMKKPPQSALNPTKSLKRSPSKAQLDEPDLPPTSILRSTSKPTFTHPGGYLPHSTSVKDLHREATADSPSPNKRTKRHGADDVSAPRPSSIEAKTTQPATPQLIKTVTYPDLSTIASPTQTSLARAMSIKSTKSSKIPGPALSRSPSNPTPHTKKEGHDIQFTPLLARSPSKATLYSNPNVEKPCAILSPLFKRSPSKAAPSKQLTDSNDKGEQSGVQKVKAAPLLARSPLKMSVTKIAESEAVESKPSSTIPFLARSPAKISMPKEDTNTQSTQTPTKSGNSLMGRFNLLRSSPMKSILRSPQRLYSNDPAKVAAGTHLATPPKQITKKDKPLPTESAAMAAVQKHVDFSSSTKDRYERAQSEASSTPSKGPTPSPNSSAESNSSPKPKFAEYPSLPSDQSGPIVTPQKRRQTAAPGDFTFRAGDDGIIFGQSPNAPQSASNSKRSSTIRHVSAEPQLPPAPTTGSKKRKFDFENDNAVDAEMDGVTSDKENADQDEPRQAKRAKLTHSDLPATKVATRLPTLGVKPKNGGKDGKDKKPNTISRARLSALAQPKRRG